MRADVVGVYGPKTTIGATEKPDGLREFSRVMRERFSLALHREFARGIDHARCRELNADNVSVARRATE
jgi:hypothetical protein